VRFFGAAGFVVLTAAGASCAAVSGLDDYGTCTGDCAGGPSSPTTTLDASTTADTSTSPTTPDASTSPEDGAAASGDAGEGQPDEGSELGDAGIDGPGVAPPADAHTEDVASPPVDAGPDAAPVVDAGGVGPVCGPLSLRAPCSKNQVCCANLVTQTNACSAPASCASNATLSCSTAADCPGSAPICCAQMTLAPDLFNDPPPKCTVSSISASCAASCSDNPPSDPTTCKYPPSGTGTVRLCSHAADCASDTALLGVGCYNFNGAPVSWCSTGVAGLEGTQQP
jgi:hypothetical protein